MRVLSPAVTCILASHMKPYLKDALASVVAQTRRDMHILVLDSGQWIGRRDPVSLGMAKVYKAYRDHPLVEWVTTGEGPGLVGRVCPISWVTNEAIRAGLVRGRYVCTFYDDDRYHPEYMARMAGFLDDHPGYQAVWCSQDRVSVAADGTETPAGGIPASEPKYGPTFDCQVDGTQVMFRREVLDAIGDPWLPEDAAVESCRHSDGIFLNKLGAAVGTVPNIPEVLVTHRYTPLSTYTPSGR